MEVKRLNPYCSARPYPAPIPKKDHTSFINRKTKLFRLQSNKIKKSLPGMGAGGVAKICVATYKQDRLSL